VRGIPTFKERRLYIYIYISRQKGLNDVLYSCRETNISFCTTVRGHQLLVAKNVRVTGESELEFNMVVMTWI
jgi:hypothetical protein